MQGGREGGRTGGRNGGERRKREGRRGTHAHAFPKIMDRSLKMHPNDVYDPPFASHPLFPPPSLPSPPLLFSRHLLSLTHSLPPSLLRTHPPPEESGTFLLHQPSEGRAETLLPFKTFIAHHIQRICEDSPRKPSRYRLDGRSLDEERSGIIGIFGNGVEPFFHLQGKEEQGRTYKRGEDTRFPSHATMKCHGDGTPSASHRSLFPSLFSPLPPSPPYPSPPPQSCTLGQFS